MNINIFHDFVASRKNIDDFVNISAFTELYNQSSPQKQTLDQRSENPFRDATMVIVSNFCKLFSGHIMFPIVGLKMLSDILKVETVDETQQARLSILIHLTKTPYNPAKFTNFLYEVLNLNISAVVQKNGCHWHVNDVITAAVGELGHRCIESAIDVQFVSIGISELRGFTGINTIYINTNHFAQKISSKNARNAWLDKLIEIDVTVVIHELGHVKLRQATNDFNMPTPPMVKNKGLGENYCEFGRLVESKIFGKAIDWLTSQITVSKTKVFEIVAAVKQNTVIPNYKKSFEASTAEREGHPNFFAFDVDIKKEVI